MFCSVVFLHLFSYRIFIVIYFLLQNVPTIWPQNYQGEFLLFTRNYISFLHLCKFVSSAVYNKFSTRFISIKKNDDFMFILKMTRMDIYTVWYSKNVLVSNMQAKRMHMAYHHRWAFVTLPNLIFVLNSIFYCGGIIQKYSEQ